MTLASPEQHTIEPRGRAQVAAKRAGVTILEVASPAEAARAAELLREVWRGPQAPVPANLLRTVQHIGGYVFGAYDEAGGLLAVSMGLLAADGLHSHITGVAPLGQRHGLGYAIKQHQRVWALERGITRVSWTCDPLMRRNVGFNLHALGASVVGYLPNHYGAMEDGVNKGDSTDRLEMHWELLGSAATAASAARLPLLQAAWLPAAVVAGTDELPVVHEVDGPARRVQLPRDIEALRQADPAAAQRWRRAIREAVLPALAGGAAVRGLTEAGELVIELVHSH